MNNTRQPVVTTLPAPPLKDIKISFRSRFFTKFLKCVLKPIIARFAAKPRHKIAKTHLFLAKRPCKNTAGLPQHYRNINGVPGPTVGEFPEEDERVNTRVILWYHGGGFLIPASEETHLRMLALLCKASNAVGFLPDYRLAPFNQFPAALDDAERAYLGLLEAGFKAENIWVGGDSAGGNLTLGMLQRARKAGAAMPAVATLLSPVAEMGRIHSPPSRARGQRRDPLIPIGSMGLMDDLYAQDWDASDPELSPIHADYTGMPPMHYIAGETEVLLDDTLFCWQRAKDAGVQTQCDVWPVLPHAFPLFEPLFPETRIVRQDMVQFAEQHLGKTS